MLLCARGGRVCRAGCDGSHETRTLATFADTGAALNEFFFSRVVALSAPARGSPYSGVQVGVRVSPKSSGVTRPSKTFTGTGRPASSSCQMRAVYVPGGTLVIV